MAALIMLLNNAKHPGNFIYNKGFVVVAALLYAVFV
jgi:hypothetical protein